eukprot:COSAG05_NODE_2238_length_3355_cov_1.687039_3_plen_396_part_00
MATICLSDAKSAFIRGVPVSSLASSGGDNSEAREEESWARPQWASSSAADTLGPGRGNRRGPQPLAAPAVADEYGASPPSMCRLPTGNVIDDGTFCPDDELFLMARGSQAYMHGAAVAGGGSSGDEAGGGAMAHRQHMRPGGDHGLLPSFNPVAADAVLRAWNGDPKPLPPSPPQSGGGEDSTANVAAALQPPPPIGAGSSFPDGRGASIGVGGGVGGGGGEGIGLMLNSLQLGDPSAHCAGDSGNGHNATPPPSPSKAAVRAAALAAAKTWEVPLPSPLSASARRAAAAAADAVSSTNNGETANGRDQDKAKAPAEDGLHLGSNGGGGGIAGQARKLEPGLGHGQITSRGFIHRQILHKLFVSESAHASTHTAAAAATTAVVGKADSGVAELQR